MYNPVGPVAMYLYGFFSNNALYVPSNVHNMTNVALKWRMNKALCFPNMKFILVAQLIECTNIYIFMCLKFCMSCILSADYLQRMQRCAVALKKCFENSALCSLILYVGSWSLQPPQINFKILGNTAVWCIALQSPNISAA